MDRQLVIYSGRLEAVKRVDRVINAFLEIADSFARLGISSSRAMAPFVAPSRRLYRRALEPYPLDGMV